MSNHLNIFVSYKTNHQTKFYLYIFFRARDVWLVGTLIWEIFNGNGATSATSYRQLGSIPRPLSAAYGELMNSNPSLRCSLDKLIESPFIQNNSLVQSLLFLEHIQVRSFLLLLLNKFFFFYFS